MEQIENAGEARLEDRFRIEQVMRRWCRAVDRRDWALVRSVFHPGAIDDHGMYKGDIDGLIEWLEARHQCITMSMHVLGNVFIEFADRWFFVFDGPWEYDKPWTLRTYLAFLPGFISIIIGCLVSK